MASTTGSSARKARFQYSKNSAGNIVGLGHCASHGMSADNRPVQVCIATNTNMLPGRGYRQGMQGQGGRSDVFCLFSELLQLKVVQNN